LRTFGDEVADTLEQGRIAICVAFLLEAARRSPSPTDPLDRVPTLSA
jgi:hypothetical protein